MPKTDDETNTQVAAVEIFDELSPDEERERHRLETRVDRALGEGWSALKQLRDLRLYRSTHETFEEYAKDRFGYNRAHAYRLINAAAVLENLAPTERLEEMSPIWRQKMPSSESQCRELAKLPAQRQPKAWEKVLSVAGDKAPTAQIVKTVVERMKEKQLFPARDFCAVGDVFTLARLQSRERKYNGYPCVAIELKQFTICVDVHDTTLTVKPENLQKLDSPEAHRQLPQILRRIKRLRQVGTLDRGANHFLAGVGRQVYLTEVEEMLLSCLEAHYKVEVEDCRSHPNH